MTCKCGLALDSSGCVDTHRYHPQLRRGWDWASPLWTAVQAVALVTLIGLWVAGLFTYACAQPPGCP